MDFVEFPKMARLSREIVITEKLDGTNAQVFVGEDGTVKAGSRSRWITPADDNFGFALWVEQNKDELVKLGPGRHYGEWWGLGIQRGYGLHERRFSLFNVSRWVQQNADGTRGPLGPKQEYAPKCCHVVPILYRGPFDTDEINTLLLALKDDGSQAAPGFMKPEGIVVWHTAANIGFKKTIEKDEVPKSLANVA